ncbi:MAG: hypothetical protein WC836_13805 [Desulfobacula sp.]|jgi:hypothetical protein
MIYKRKGLILFVFLVCGISFFIFQGCGKKGPPVLPVIKGEKVTSPFDLKYTQNEKNIELTWNHKIDEKEAFVKPVAFDIFLARQTFEACQGCPFEFKKIGIVSMPSMKFITGIEKGFKYYFRVQAKGKDNLLSEFSETVLFEYK